MLTTVGHEAVVSPQSLASYNKNLTDFTDWSDYVSPVILQTKRAIHPYEASRRVRVEENGRKSLINCLFDLTLI